MKLKTTFKFFGMFLCLSLLQGRSYSQQLTQQFTFSTDQVEISQDSIYDFVTLTDSGILETLDNAGKPQLPVKYFNLLLPQGAIATSVTVSDGQETQIKGRINMYPAQPPAYPNFSDPPLFVPQDPIIYNSNTPFPANQLVQFENHGYREYSYVNIAYIPFRYIPLSKTLYFQTQLTITVNYTVNGGNDNQKLRAYNSVDELAFETIKKSVTNSSSATNFYPGSVMKMNNYNPSTSVSGPEYQTAQMPTLEGNEVIYVIITNNTDTSGQPVGDLVTKFQQFADWKTQSGTPAKVVTVDAIRAKYPGADVQEKIRNFIKDAHQLWGTEYVLLGGNSTIIPVRWIKHSFDMPTDLYYSAIYHPTLGYSDNWNANGNNIFGQNTTNNSSPDFADYTPDIAIGRAPVDSQNDVQNFLKKNFAYTRNSLATTIPGGSWLGKTLMGYGAAFDNNFNSTALKVAYDIVQNHHNDTDIWNMMEYDVTRDLPCSDNHTWGLAYYDLHSTCTVNNVDMDDEDLLHDDILAQINQGYNITNILDHGGPYGIGLGKVTNQTPSLTAYDFQNLTDTNKYGILLAGGCHTAAIERGLYIGEQWVNSPGGGVAYYGASADIWASSSYAFNYEFYNTLFTDNVFKLGWTHVVTAMNSNSNSIYLTKIFQNLGDPDLSIYTAVPSTMSVVHANSILNGNQDFDVNVSGFPIGEMVKVSLYKEGEVLAYTETSNFPVTFNITPDTVGQLQITATCHNTEPYEASIPVTQLSGTHLYKSDLTLTDENGNGIIEPGEVIDLSFELSNTGGTGATGITAILSTTSTNTQISQNTSSYPNIASNQSGNSITDYTFNAGTENYPGNVIPFVLTITSSQGTFTEPFLLNIQSSILDLGDHRALVDTFQTNTFNIDDEIELFVDINNLGSVTSESVNAVLTTNLPTNKVAIIDGSYFFGNINSSAQVTNTDAFDITVGPNYNGEALLFDLTLTDAFGKTDVFALDLTEASPPLITGFDYTSTHNEINSFWDVVSNIKGYNVYRSDTETGTFEKQNDFLITSAATYNDVDVSPLSTYWYKVSVVSLSGNELDLGDLIAYRTETKLQRHGGFPIQTYPSAASGNLASPTVYDIDGDGQQEIFLNFRNPWQSSIGKGRIMGFYSTGEELFNIDGNETEVWGFAETPLALHSNSAVGDVNNNGHAEVFAIGRDNDTNSGQLYAYRTTDSNSDNNPDLLWPSPANIGHRAYRNPVLADVNNDGYMEIIVLDEKQRVLVYNRNKVLLGSKQIGASDYALGELAVADIDQDGYKEIVISCKEVNGKGAIFIWNHNGNFTVTPTLLREFGTDEKADNGLVLADIDNDGKYEVLTITRKEISSSQADGRVYAINVENGTAVNSNWNGSMVISLPTGNYQSTVIPRMATGDLDHDGRLETVFGSKDNLYVIDSLGDLWPNFPLSIENVADTSPILADIDEDNDIEIIVNTNGIIKAFNIDGSECAGWSLEADNHSLFIGSPSISDIDGDGMNEVIIGSGDAITYVWDTSGDSDKVEWGSYRGDAQNTAVYKAECTYSSLATQTVTFGDVVWTTDKHIQGDLIVKPNASLTISPNINVTFTRNSKVIIEPGGKLTIDGGIFTTDCGALWKGIRVQGNNNLAQTSANQGTIILKNNAVIEHAEIGIYAGTDPNNISLNNGSGAIVNVDGAIFRDNIIGVKMPTYPYDNASTIRNSLFENSEYLTDLENYPNANILLAKVKPIIIFNNVFKNLQEIDPYTNTHDLPKQGNGIVATDAKMDVWSNHFENLNVSIQLQGTGSGLSTTYININENTFEKNWNAVYLNSIDGVEITSNSIDVFDTFLDGQGVDGTSGLYIVNSNGFHIENNNIYSSAAQGLSTGIFIRDCKAVNEIYRNQLTDLYTGVFAMGQNIKQSSILPDISQGLELVCNEFNDNATDIYLAPLTRIASYQGTTTLSAGNKFLPECSGTVNEFNNQGYQVNYLGETGGVYLPDCSYNVNVFSNGGHNACESTLGKYFGSSDLVQSETAIEENQAQYFALTDGGDTEALNETIDETESNEALVLRNQLLEESPFLSDTIMVKTTSVEDVLPAVMVKEILVANPKAAKSDKVQLALDSRQNLLPTYMRSEIDQGKRVLSQKEDLESLLAKSFYYKENILNRMALGLTMESSKSSLDSLETLLVSQVPKSIYRNYQLVNFYLSRKETQNAQKIFNNIPRIFELNSKELEEYNKLGDLLEIHRNIIESNKSILEVDNNQMELLLSIATDSTSIAGMESRAILSYIEGTDYGLPIPAKIESSSRNSTGKNIEPGTLNVFPEVANDYFIVEYSLAENEAVEDADIKIVDVENNEIQQTHIGTRENQILLECKKWQEGPYWAVKTISGKIVDKKRVIIDRGNLPIDMNSNGPFDQENVLRVYPNPAQDYFFVITNNNAKSTLQVTNGLGQVIDNFSIKDRETKISTLSWSKGVYFVTLSSQEYTSTVKVIIR